LEQSTLHTFLQERAMLNHALLLALIFVLAGCGGGVTTPCDYSDLMAPCARAHGQVHGGG
jgi:hypothetical protein